MGKVEGTVWICGTIIVLTIVLYSVGGFELVASAYDRIMNPTPAVAPDTTNSGQLESMFLFCVASALYARLMQRNRIAAAR